MPANAKIISERRYDLPLSRLMMLYNSAAFVVVTHHGTDNLIGVNVLLAAMPMANAVVPPVGEGIDIDPVTLHFGLKIPPHDVDALETSIRKLLTNKEPTRRMGKMARHLVEAGFNTHAMANRIYDTMIGGLA